MRLHLVTQAGASARLYLNETESKAAVREPGSSQRLVSEIASALHATDGAVTRWRIQAGAFRLLVRHLIAYGLLEHVPQLSESARALSENAADQTSLEDAHKEFRALCDAMTGQAPGLAEVGSIFSMDLELSDGDTQTAAE